MIAWLAKIVGSIFGMKFFMGGVLMTVLGLIFYNLVVGIVEEVMAFTVAQINGTAIGEITSPTISGFAGWFLGVMQFPACISVIVSCVAIKFVLRKIPFLKW